MSVAPGVMTAFALSRKAAGSPLCCDTKKMFSFDLLSPVAVTSAQRRCPSASVPWSALKTRSFQRRYDLRVGYSRTADFYSVPIHIHRFVGTADNHRHRTGQRLAVLGSRLGAYFTTFLS